jgi:putative ABC transport system substrate-binding protein
MKRRTFIRALAGATAWPLAARAQPSKTVHRIGFLGLGTARSWEPRIDALTAGLRDLGYMSGENFVFEFGFAEDTDGLREAAAQLVRKKVDVIFASTSTEVEAARQATQSIPIVFATHADPVGVGHVASLPRPGGNITGLTVVQADLTSKALEIFKEALPRAQRLGILYSPAAPSHRPTLAAAQDAAASLKLDILAVAVQGAGDFENAFATMTNAKADGFFVSASALTLSQREALAELGLKHRLPGMFGARDNVAAGGLMSYSPDATDLTRRATVYIDRIMKGARPADLPVEQSSRYLLAINLKTSRAIGLDLPQTLVFRADEVFE